MSRPQVSSLHSRGASRGFTLVEVLVALTILTTALVPAFVLASSATNLSVRIRNELIASGLAQEGVEVVRAIRDANWFAAQPFESGLDSCASGCTFQYDSTGPELAAPDALLRLDPDSGLYQYKNGAPTIFSRSIAITHEPASPEMTVTSTVTWNEHSVVKTVTVEYHLFDWIK